ncbi:AMP-binding protein [Streptomyces polychromogenes]|nr:AMP-binding protein [Streptomyces polychromogenes]
MTQASPPAGPGRPSADTVLERFEQWARDTPGAPALITRGGDLSYAGLDARANRLAHHLLARGLPADARVAIAPTRREDTVVALLATLKAGAAYALLDAGDTRTARVQLTALGPDLLLTDAAGEARLDQGEGLPALLTDAEAEGMSARLNPEDRHLFTGGADLTAFAAGWTRALCSGAALVLPEGTAWTPGEIPEAVAEHEVSALHTDPAGALRLLDRSLDPAGAARRGRREPAPRLSTLRLLTVTGDRLHLDQQTTLHDRLRPGARVLNVYAPAETAGAGTWFELPQLPRPLDEPERLALLGTPFPGSRAELRSGELLLTPPGGADPLPTGDLAVLRPDGLLEFAGRLRDRITLADGSPLDPHPVESVLRTHPGVGAAVLAPVGSRRNTRLVAYVAPPPDDPGPDGGAPVDVEGLRDHLAGRVPEAGSPVRLVRLRTLPRTRAGQEDRAAVPQPPEPGARPAGSGKYGSPAGGETPGCFGFGCAAVPLAVLALFATDLIWPGSTDLTGVPGPWSFLFSVLYFFECSAFAAGLLFLFAGRSRMRRPGPGRGLTTAAHLAVVYLLLAWWPQDNLYRLAAKQDWPRQAALVYTFNIPLMIAAFIVAVYLTRRPAAPPSGSDG